MDVVKRSINSDSNSDRERNQVATSTQPLDAGDFGSWVVEMQAAILGDAGSDVACGSCTACCSSSQFVHIGPEETVTIARIPKALRFAAPGLPKGHLLLGYDNQGRCPMLIDDSCSIYEDRPQTCRTYDCRIFPAAGLSIQEKDKVLIDRQARRWSFTYSTRADEARHDAVRAASSWVTKHLHDLPRETVPANTTQQAVMAFRIHGAFCALDESNGLRLVDPDLVAVLAEIEEQTGRLRDRD
jgi:uncharacterized protein